jgi:hypothetical protein
MPIKFLFKLWESINNQPQHHFERNAGYWSSPVDEVKIAFFTKLTDRKSQREDWYKITPYIAEFWCTISNVGFIVAGLHRRSPELIFAGTASIVSHAIPKQCLLTIDKIGALLPILRLACEYKVIIRRPILLLPIAATIGLNVADIYFARIKGKTWLHSVWHLSAACVADFVLGVIQHSKSFVNK